MSAALATGGDVALVLAATAEAYRVTPHQILSRAMARQVIDARVAAMHVARRMTKRSLPALGASFRRDHTTVLSADRRIESESERDPALRGRIEAIADAVRVGRVDGDTLAASRRALGMAEPAPYRPSPTAQSSAQAAVASARAWRAAEAAVAAWRALAQAEFTPGEKPSRAAFAAAMNTLEATLKRRA